MTTPSVPPPTTSDVEPLRRAPRYRPGTYDDRAHAYDALLLLSFGGPEHLDDVLPFLERVTAGRGVPRERLEEVAEHYRLFGGVSPINAHNRALRAMVQEALGAAGIDLPVHLAYRNAPPFVEDVVTELADRGADRLLAFATSAWSSYSGCRQYREDLARGRAAAASEVGHAPTIDKLRLFSNHPSFVATQAIRLRAALHAVPQHRRPLARVLFTAHSVPVAMADTSDYVPQLVDATQLVVEELGIANPVELVWQSRSGPPEVPWLEPDVGERMVELADAGVTDVVLVPIGFLSDHMEVLFDLDVEARELAGRLGLHLVRAGTVGPDPAIAAMVVELVRERMSAEPQRRALGPRGPYQDVCAADCCPNLRRPGTPAVSQEQPADGAPAGDA